MSSLEFQAKAFAQVGPILHVIGQALIIDDDEQIPVRVLADPRVRLIHPIAACMAAVENDLENLAVDFPITAGEAQRILELLEDDAHDAPDFLRSEEHTSELQSLMRISYAVFCLKKNNK